MTDSMIPNSFVPGTKAKANEINANFLALANAITQNKSSVNNDISDLNTSLLAISKTVNEEKADKSELLINKTVEETETDLNSYKTNGTYVFSSTYTPVNIPKGTSGTLIVTGPEDSVINQIWICNDENPEIFIRTFEDLTWSEWKSTSGITTTVNNGYLKLPNGLILQWCHGSGPIITFPVAYESFACPVFMKSGFNSAASRSDTGFRSYSLTGFVIDSAGAFASANWIAIGI